MSAVPGGARLVLLCGVLWGNVVLLAETPTLPVYDLGATDFALFLCQAQLPWLAAGLIWAAGTRIAETHGRWVLVALLPLGTAASVLAKMAFAAIEPQLTSGTGEFLRDVPVADIAPYFVWTNLFYGYLYAFGYLAARRQLRGRALLAMQRRERSEADSLLREARLVRLRGQLQPELLIEALQMLQARYATACEQGDRLFDTIVAFLRAAMPGVREQSSTLGVELETVRQYSALRDALGQPPIRLGAIATSADSVAFPPLLLLPIMDALTRNAGSDAAATLTTALSTDHYIVTLSAVRSDAPIAAALDALDAGVASVNGSIAVTREDSRVDIVISLPLDIGALADARPALVVV